MTVHHRGGRGARIRRFVGQKVEERASQRVDVDPVIECRTLDLLGCGVMQRRDEHPRPGQLMCFVQRLRGAEIGQQDPFGITSGQQDVGGLHIAMQNSGPVCMVECVPGLGHDAHRPRDFQSAGREGFPRIDAGNVLHRDPQPATLPAAVMDRHDVGVLEFRGVVGLRLEA